MAPPSESPEFVILVGPNGVGKSHVGRVLAQNFDCSFVSIEEFFTRRYPSHVAYRADHRNAYEAFRKLLERTLQQTRRTVVFEQVGLSRVDQELIAGVQQDHEVVLVEVIADLDTALARVAARGTTSNFPKTPESVRRVWELYLAEARPRYSFATKVVNENLSQEDLCARFDGIMASRRH